MHNLKSHKLILPMQQPPQPQLNQSHAGETILKSEFLSPLPPPPPALDHQKQPGSGMDPEQAKFQYILVAQTSNATKLTEPSITYLNQGQAYELRMKKIGDLSNLTNRMLLSKVRICFHERRLQYMEQEQLVEWSGKHPRERALDLDIPLSYGIIAPSIPSWQDSSQINTFSFRLENLSSYRD